MDQQRLVCLLSKEELQGYYRFDLLGLYERRFGKGNVMWAPIKDHHLCDTATLKRILLFLDDSPSKGEKVVVHCSGGSARTGHVLAAWLMYNSKLMKH